MPVSRPYRRTCRPFTNGRYRDGCDSDYVLDGRHARSPRKFIHSFLLIQQDLLKTFDYVEPCDKTLECYSVRHHELLLRSCVDIEANFKAIFNENRYTKNRSKNGWEKDWNIRDYRMIEESHFLSLYKVTMPRWGDSQKIFAPFECWSKGASETPSWYQAYNATKHDRHEEFKQANLKNVLSAVCGLAAVLASQFLDNDFAPTDRQGGFLALSDYQKASIGGFFQISYPEAIPEDMHYEFNWEELSKEEDPYQNFDYSKVRSVTEKQEPH